VAGLNRLDRASEIVEYLSSEIFVPDAGQGALALQTRSDDETVNALVSAVDDLATHRAICAERAFLRAVDGGCQTPVGAHAWLEETRLMLRAMLADPNGAFVRYAEKLGAEAAAKLGGGTGH
jgi:hydroxymethylbilane synthase